MRGRYMSASLQAFPVQTGPNGTGKIWLEYIYNIKALGKDPRGEQNMKFAPASLVCSPLRIHKQSLVYGPDQQKQQSTMPRKLGAINQGSFPTFTLEMAAHGVWMGGNPRRLTLTG